MMCIELTGRHYTHYGPSDGTWDGSSDGYCVQMKLEKLDVKQEEKFWHETT